MKKGTLGSRLRDARTDANLSLQEVGARCGISAQAVQQWEKDRTVPDPTRLEEVATFLGVSSKWLVTGNHLSEQPGNVTIKPISHLRGRSVPRYSMLQAATAGQVPVSTHYSHSHFPCSERSFALTIEDASNAPEFLPGDSVIIDPMIDFRPGDMVFAALGAERTPVFRRIRVLAASESRYALEPMNQLWGRDEITIPDTGEIVGVMSEHTRPRR